ncbi:sugar ABC transporter ATP-binding protein, partial [Mycobacteroides abscessus subsp. massiliense]
RRIPTAVGPLGESMVIARWLTREITVLLLDEPTRGVDVGARSEIYTVIAELAAHGLAVLLVSSDMPELIGMTHRVAVLRNGAIVGELTGEELHR